MKLRTYTKIQVYWHWDSRFKEYETRSLTSVPKLQCFDDALQQWVDVPAVVETEGPGEKPE